MTRRAGVALVALMLAAFAARPQAQQACDGRTELRVDQENYVALTDRVYVYAPDIASLGASGGWQPFTLRVLSSSYRKPLLLSRGFMKEKDLLALLATRRDVRQSAVAVPGFDPKKSSKAPVLTATATVPNGEKGGTITVRVSRVAPVSRGTDQVFVVCTLGR